MTKRAGSAAPRKDANGRWYFVVDGGKDPKTGNRRQVYRRGFGTKGEAQEALDKIRGTRRTQSYVPRTKDTVAEYMAKWLEGLPAQGRQPSTVDGYRRCVDYVLPDLGAKRLDALTPADLDALYGRLLVSGKRRKPFGPLSPRSVRYVHTVVSKALSDAVRKGTLARNVAAVADPPSAKSAKPPEQAWWTPAELQSFLALTADEPFGGLFHVAAMTGMRRGEVCGLRWSDVDLDAAKIEVRQQLLVVRSPGAPDGGLLFSARTKTDHGRRKIELDAQTVSVLRAQKRRQTEHRLLLGAGWSNERGLVFTEPDGSCVDPESVAKVFARRVAKSKLPRIRFHDLRHSHCAHLIASGQVPLLAITKRLGHSSVAFTQDRYGHLLPDAGSQAADAVAAMVYGSGA
jgi:integrase